MSLTAVHSRISTESDGEDVLLQCPSLPRWEVHCDIRLLKKQHLINIFYIALNTIATIAVTFLNKIVVGDPQLAKCQVLFAMSHFAITFIVLFLATRRPFQILKPTRLPLLQMLPICFFFAGFLIANNCSLSTNSIGFYQLAKILTTPAVVVLGYLLFRKTVSHRKVYAVLAMCIGVAMTNTGEVTSNPRGAAIATVAFIITACYQIWISKKLNDLDVSPAQLLLNQAPISVMLLACLVPFFDTIPDLASLSPQVCFAFVASGFVASLINLSQFLIIGRTSALTFNVVSMIKMVSILSLGWFLESKHPSPHELAGVIIALAGAWSYASR